MKNKDSKNILVITKSPWGETNAFGNTLSNFFGGWNDVNFYNIYCREELPQNDVCCSYFNITERNLLKYIFSPDKIGRQFSCADINKKRESKIYKNFYQREKQIVDFFREKGGTISLIAREILWNLGGWRNKQLDSFLNENEIDIIFAAAADPIYLQKIISYSLEKTNASLVLFFADDIYSHKTYSPLRYLYQYVLRRTISSSVKKAVKLYGCSPLLCEEYEKYFDKRIEPLYKGCSFNNCVKKESVSSPIKLVYAGNLFFGRWRILKALADEIVKINEDFVKMVLEIYTTTTITQEIDAALNRTESSRIMGTIPYDDVKKVLQRADIVLHVESFDTMQAKTTRLSFSTKIIDCMQSGSCMMAIGPSNIASIKYLSNIDGVIVVNDIKMLGSLLKDIINDRNCIIENSEKLNQYARIHHNINVNRKMLENDFGQILSKVMS
ncbi:MAG: hypothetical protein K0R31_423 [Clostridiales bacterium]|nr:hypothetical protein [Clostridiales bacterium]